MRTSASLILCILAVSAPALAADTPAMGPADVQAELALRDECKTLSTKLVLGFKKARAADAAPSDGIEKAGFDLPESTDIAAQASRLRRECIKDAAGTTSLTWAAVEVSAQSKALMSAAFRCVLKGVSLVKPVHEAELELEGCYTPEYAGLPSRLGGHTWTLQLTEAPAGTALEARARISGDDAATVCTLLNEYRLSSSPVTCQVRDSFSVVRVAMPLALDTTNPDTLTEALKRMAEDYKKATPASPEPASSVTTQ